MAEANTSRTCVELEIGADPIRGSIERSDGSRHTFWGWLELMEALQRAAADHSESSASPVSNGRPPKPDARGQ